MSDIVTMGAIGVFVNSRDEKHIENEGVKTKLQEMKKRQKESMDKKKIKEWHVKDLTVFAKTQKVAQRKVEIIKKMIEKNVKHQFVRLMTSRESTKEETKQL